MSLDRHPPYDFTPTRLDPGNLPGELVERRKRLAGVAIAGALVGVHRDKNAEAALLLPFDPPAKALHYLASGKSTCALTTRGYNLLLGSVHDVLLAPYLPRDGKAVSDVVTIARGGGAWRTPEPGHLPHPADVVLIGHADERGRPDPAYCRGTNATEHVLIVTRLDGDLLESVDGGQPGIERRTRRVVRIGRELWLAHTDHGLGPDGRPLVGRRVVGWQDTACLPTPDVALLPEGCVLAT